jgi:hypothetical protein
VEIAGESELRLKQERRETRDERRGSSNRRVGFGARFFSSLVSRLSSLLCFLALLLPGVSSAQSTARDSLPRITGIIVRRNNVFDSGDSTWFARTINSIHVTTFDPLIRRELLVHVGERYDSARIAESERNLRALGVFRAVEIDSISADSGVVLRVTTHDGWTTRPTFSFHSTGGSVAYTLALIEDNLLGTLTQTDLLYEKDPDRTTTVLRLYRGRLIGGKIAGTLFYADRSDGKLGYAQLALPYFETASPLGAALTFDDRSDQILQYRGGIQTPSDSVQNRYVLGRADFSRALRASPFGYLRVGVAVQARRDDYVSDSTYQSTGFGSASVTGAFGAWVELSSVKNPKIRGFQTLGHQEDIDLGTTVRVSLFNAPKFLGYTSGHTGLAPSIGLHTGAQFDRGFAYADAFAGGLYTATGLDSGQVFLSGTIALLPSARHELTLHGEVGALQNPLPGTEFDLGLGAGPRAFSQHSFTGNREFFGTAEYRYTVNPEMFKVIGVAVAAFVDHGGAWWSGDTERSGWDFGVGLRLAASRAPDLDLNRIDLAWRATQPGLPGGWVVAVGKGFVFATGPRGTSR